MTHYIVGVLAWSALALLAGIAIGKSIRLADQRGHTDCRADGHPDAGDDDLFDVGLAVLHPVTVPLRAVRPAEVRGPQTTPIALTTEGAR